MKKCKCSTFEDLEMLREVISKRIKQSKKLRRVLSPLAKTDDCEHILMKCGECGQYWQGSQAWNWGNDFYLFGVPSISPNEWLNEIYVQPDELLIYTASIQNMLERGGGFEPKGEPCRVEACNQEAINGLIHCIEHHINNLQKINQLPINPVGRWFLPYLPENFLPKFNNQK